MYQNSLAPYGSNIEKFCILLFKSLSTDFQRIVQHIKFYCIYICITFITLLIAPLLCHSLSLFAKKIIFKELYFPAHFYLKLKSVS